MSRLWVVLFCLFFGKTIAQGSWQGYVDDQLVGTGHLSAGAIIGNRDGGVWAISPGFAVNAGERKPIVDLFKNPSSAFSNGVTVNGVKYMGIKADSRSIYGKKGAHGVVLVRTNQAILIGYYNDKQQPGAAANAVEKLGDYLTENAY